MVSFLRHIICVFCLFMLTNLSAQVVPWIAPSASLNAVPLLINCIPQVDGRPLADGDYIGIFNDQDRCFGLASWKDTANFKITVYGSDGTIDGFNTGEKLNLKIWLRNEGCIVEKISQVNSDNPLVFSNSVTNQISILNFERLSVSYSKENYCLNEAIILPVLNYNADISFSSDVGINLNASSGAIDPSKSTPGIYDVELNSVTCLTQKKVNLILNDFPRPSVIPDTFLCGDKPLRISLKDYYSNVQWSTGENTSQVELTDPATIWYRVTNSKGCSNADTFVISRTAIKRLEYSVDEASCFRKGRITIRDREIENGRAPYSFRLSSQLDNLEFNELNEIPEGIYNIEVINANGCVLQHTQRIIVKKDCLNDIPVFTPNDDGQDDRYFIHLEGNIKIFDRTGALKRRLIAPCYFDGTDESGHPLPMGIYMVISDKGEKVELTIIR